MKINRTCAFFLFSVTSAAFASGATEHHASPADLIAPAVNFIILTGFLVYKLKTPVKNFFDKKHGMVVEQYERAALKSREAQAVLDTEQKKLSAVDNEIDAINRASEQELQKYMHNLTNELRDKTEKIKLDAVSKIAAEKNQMIAQLNLDLVTDLISKTKKVVSDNKDLHKKVSTKLLEGLR